MLELTGKRGQKTVEITVGRTILQHALDYDVAWGYNCRRGDCARCRALVTEGGDLLCPPNKAEMDRLDEEEIAAGYRLGCQAVVSKDGRIAAANKTYF